jgi:protein-S-isoprenylcysteine O-methyltransferase Ste14
MGESKPSIYDNVFTLIYSVLMFLPVVLVFIFPNYYGFGSLVYLGWMVLAVGLILVFVAGYEFQKEGGVPEGKHLVHTTVLVDSGIYAVVRHPQYLGFILFALGLALISQHWLSAISGVIGSVLFYMDVRKEEEANIEKFGDDYTSYMEKVPRMNIVVGAIRLLRSSSKE